MYDHIKAYFTTTRFNFTEEEYDSNRRIFHIMVCFQSNEGILSQDETDILEVFSDR